MLLDRHGEQRDDAEWIATMQLSDSARYVLLRRDGRALVDGSRTALRGLRGDEAAALIGAAPPVAYLGSDASDWFLVHAEDELAERVAGEIGGAFVDLRSAGLTLPESDAGLFAYARALSNWQQRMRHCSLCAAPLTFEAAGHRARCTNPSCASLHFPHTDPAIIVIVTDGEKCLLGRGTTWPERRFSTLAGFVEPGETLEDAVRREVFEEAGVRVGDCDYHSSQPWPFPASIMLGFTAQADDPMINVGPELAEARWFGVEEFVDALKSKELVISPPLSVSYRLIEHWLRSTAGIELAAVANDEPFLARR
ncbi:MAG: NAD(+) diphosphatase [Rudaea sp.]